MKSSIAKDILPADTQLERNVMDALNSEPGVIPAHIGVMVASGVVTLTGHVETLPEKRAAELAVGKVPGVKAIAQEIEVRLSSVTNQTDDAIATGAINQLSWTTLVPQNAVKVEVEKGWITLTGTVQDGCQKDAAEQIVHQLYGAIGVTNRIVVVPMEVDNSPAES